MPGTMKNKPAKCCCGPCVIDHYATETAFTAGVIRSAQHPQSPYPTWLQAEVKAVDGAVARLYLAWDESTPGDGLYIEFTPQDGATNGTLKLYRKDGTQLGTTLQLLCADETYWHRITACYDPDTDEFTACFDARDARDYVVQGQCVSATVPSGFAAGRKAGYGGTGSIKNYRFERLWYIGAGSEQPCCEPTIEETQLGRDPGAGPIVCFDFSGLPTPPATATLNIKFPDGSYGTVDIDIYMNANDVRSAFEAAATAAGYPAGGHYSVTQTGDTFCIEATGEFDGTAIAEGGYPATFVEIDIGLDPSARLSYTPGTETGFNSEQTITLPVPLPVPPCAYALQFDDETTSSLDETTTAAEMQTALEALTTIGSGNVSVTGSTGGPYVVEFIGTLGLQDVSLLTSISTDPDQTCLDCDGDYYNGDYYSVDNCPRTVCHRCGSPSCTVVSETFTGIPGDINTPGDMPCGWDAVGTNWQVVDGAATGDGAVCHKFDTTAGSYIVEATFDLGHLEVQGDAVTVSITYGSATASLTITRVAGALPGDPDRYFHEWIPSDFDSYYTSDYDASVTLKICPSLICHDKTSDVSSLATITPGPVCVSITQPTMSGHEDASLIAFSITKSYQMDANCPACTCRVDCSDCEFPAYIFVEIGPAFLTKQYDCAICEDISGTLALASEGDGSCRWRYNGGYCDCNDPDCNPPATYRKLIWFVRAWFARATGVWSAEIWTGPSPMVDPGSACSCGAGRGVYGSATGYGCDSSPITLTRFAGVPGPGGSDPSGPGAECVGVYPPTIRIALDIADL